MTLIILMVLATAWLGYFALWFRDRRASRRLRGDAATSQYFDRTVDAVNRAPVPLMSLGGRASTGDSSRNLGDLLESPQTHQQALRRRRHVATVLVSAAVASLLAVPVFGSAALFVHVMADMVLILFAFGSFNRRQAPAADLADIRVLYPDRPAPSDAVAMPMGRVANG